MIRVLIVDDDVNIRNLLELALREAGFAVLTASDGKEGLALATQYAPDVAILDVMMPGMHGYELCRRMRADPRSARTRIIFLTARAQPIDEQAGLEAGADLFLAKPVMPDELVETIRALAAPLPQAKVATTDRPEAAPPAPAVQGQEEGGGEAAPPAPPAAGRLICCFSLQPQVGVTTLAVNLSLALALYRHEATPLVELHRASAGLLQALGLKPVPPAGGFWPAGGALRWEVLVLYLVGHPSGVRALPAPPADDSVPPAGMGQAVALLRSRFPLLVADVTSQPDAAVQSVLSGADLVLLVVTPDVATLRSALRAIQGLRKLGVRDANVSLVVNHVRPQAEVPVEKIREGMACPIAALIPHAPGMQEAFRAGRPWLLAEPRSPASQAIGRLAVQIAKGV